MEYMFGIFYKNLRISFLTHKTPFDQFAYVYNLKVQNINNISFKGIK